MPTKVSCLFVPRAVQTDTLFYYKSTTSNYLSHRMVMKTSVMMSALK